MSTRAFARALIVAACLCGSSTPAWADDRSSTAAELFKAAEAAYAKQDYRAAALAFEAAHANQPHGGAMYNAGLAWQTAGESARAADAFAAAIAAPGLGDVEAADARKRLEGLEPSLGRIAVTAPDGARVSVAHVEGAPARVRVHVKPGTHTVRVTLADGTKAERTVATKAGEVVPVSFDAAPKPSAQPDETPARVGTTQRVAGWVALVGGAAVFAAGIPTILVGLGARDDWDASNHTDTDLQDRAKTFRTLGNVLLIGGAVIGATGLVLVITAPSPPPSNGGPTAFGASVRGSF